MRALLLVALVLCLAASSSAWQLSLFQSTTACTGAIEGNGNYTGGNDQCTTLTSTLSVNITCTGKSSTSTYTVVVGSSCSNMEVNALQGTGLTCLSGAYLPYSGSVNCAIDTSVAAPVVLSLASLLAAIYLALFASY